MSASTSTTPCKRQAPGGNSSVVLGDDSSTWASSSIAVRETSGAAVAAGQFSHGPRMSPGGVDSVQLGGPMSSPTAEYLLAKPSPGGLDSITFGKAPADDLPVVALLSRFPVGGADSVDFAEADEQISASDLMARPSPGGQASVVLGGDHAQWSTDSQAVGVGSADFCTSMEARTRTAPGGSSSIDFGAEVTNPSLQTLMARSSPGGSDSVDFSGQPAVQTSAEELMTRPRVGGSATVVLGQDAAQWMRDSSTVGAGSADAVASMKSVARPAPGGVDSVDFSCKSVASSKEELMARPAVGGQANVVLGGDQSAWTTDSSTVGVGSHEAASNAGPRALIPTGGVDSVNGITDAVAPASVGELLARSATGGGGKTSVVLGGDVSDYATSSDNCKIPSGYVAEAMPRQVPGGVDSIDFGAVPTHVPTADALLARPAIGGMDSVEFGKGEGSTLSSAQLLNRPFPGGNAKIVLGSVGGDWATSGQAHNQKVHDNVDDAHTGVARPPPGGVDSVVMAVSEDNGLSAEALLARPAVGGSATLVLGEDRSKWSTCGNAVGVGCADAAGGLVMTTARTALGATDSINFANDSLHTPAKPLRTMNAAAATSRMNLEDKSFTPTPGVSSNRFACGSNQNAGNVLTDRPTTRLHQAPGGNSSINLGHDSASPAVGESKKRGQSNNIQQPPGGASTIFFGNEKFQGKAAQDENMNSANLQQALQNTVKVTQAPGGDSAMVLG